MPTTPNVAPATSGQSEIVADVSKSTSEPARYEPACVHSKRSGAAQFVTRSACTSDPLQKIWRITTAGPAGTSRITVVPFTYAIPCWSAKIATALPASVKPWK
jgi:hypothetical protein